MNSKIIKGSIEALLLLPVLIFAKDTLQVEIKKSDVWQLIGVNGLHNANGSSSTAGTTWSTISGVSGGDVMDTVDDDGNTTWYNFNAGSAVTTTDDNASIGVLIIGGEILPNGNTASTTTPDKVYIKGSFKTFKPTSPKSTMYLKSTSSSNPVVKITYQSNMEGTNIYIKFDNINDANYYTNIKLDSSKTFENALILAGLEYNNTTTATTSTSLVSSILQVYDENLSDNNRSLFPYDKFNLNSGVTTKYAGTHITLFKYDSGSWKLYDSRNTIGNDFNKFEVGKGYWAKIQKSKSDPSGFIFATGDIRDATWTSVFGTLINGWNLLSFNDDVLRYSPTGVFVPFSSISNSGLTITDAFGSNSFELISGACDSEKNASAYINFKVMQADQNGSANFKLRAYPAQKFDGSSSGIVILSSHRFEINISTATTLAGDNLKIDPINNQYYPKYGEYMLGVKPNDAVFNLNAPIKATLQGYDNTAVNDSRVDLTDKNLTGFATELNNALANIKKNNAYTYLIDTNWNGNNETILMAADIKFGIKESSYYKLFKQVDSGTNIYVEGNLTGTSAPQVSVDSNFTITVEDINNTYSQNGVKAFATKPSKNIMILISDQRGLDIKEGNSKNVIEDLPISFNDGNNTKKGAFTEVYDSSDLIKIVVNYDNNDTYDYTNRKIGQAKQPPTYLTPNLGHQTVWVRDFPLGVGAIQKMAKLSNKRVKLIFTAARTPNGARWLSLDATKSPAVWYDVNDTQTLMWTEKERGYWVYLEDYTAPTITQTAGAPTSTVVTTHFDNNVSSSGTSTTYNYVRKDIPVTVSGIDPKYQDSEFTYASVGGTSFPLINNVGSRLLSVDSYGMDIPQSTSDTSIDLYTYDGVGGDAKTTAITTVGVIQPSAPSLSWGATGELTIANTGFVSWQIHEGNISDIDINASLKASVTATNFDLSSLGLDPNWNKITDATPYFEMKVVTVGGNGFYSDIQAFKYAPVHENTHVLSTSLTTYDEAPGTYITSTTAPTLIADSGVGLKSLTGKFVTMAYQPLTNDNEYVRLNNNLPKIMFVQDLNNNPIATIKFVDDYIGEKFYIYDANSTSLFYGKFQTGYDNYGQRYTLTKIDNYGNNGQIIIKP